MTKDIIPFDYEKISGRYNVPKVTKKNLKEQVVTAIKNAWDSYGALDEYGRIWLNSKGAHIVLRTNRANAKYLIANLSNDQKIYDGPDLFIKGESVCYLLDASIQNARSLLRENYIQHSQLFYLAIRNCSRARELRAEHYEYIKKITKTLKNQRINSFHIRYDELTGELLKTSSSQFSHIRSVSLYPHLSGFIANGLIVNSDTHRIITDNGINDEEELYELCNEYNWNTSWYDLYSNFLINP